MTNVDEWGKKRLAYEIQKMKEAFYYFIQFESDSVCPNEVGSTHSYYGASYQILMRKTGSITDKERVIV